MPSSRVPRLSPSSPPTKRDVSSTDLLDLFLRFVLSLWSCDVKLSIFSMNNQQMQVVAALLAFVNRVES
jgi:hypothetical protein